MSLRSSELDATVTGRLYVDPVAKRLMQRKIIKVKDVMQNRHNSSRFSHNVGLGRV